LDSLPRYARKDAIFGLFFTFHLDRLLRVARSDARLGIGLWPLHAPSLRPFTAPSLRHSTPRHCERSEVIFFRRGRIVVAARLTVR